MNTSTWAARPSRQKKAQEAIKLLGLLETSVLREGLKYQCTSPKDAATLTSVSAPAGVSRSCLTSASETLRAILRLPPIRKRPLKSSQPPDSEGPDASLGLLRPESHTLTVCINGHDHTLQVKPWVTLLDLLRERLDLTGTKKGCDHGQCGACTVLVDGKRINACLTLAVMQEGREITTVEGLADGEDLNPLQEAFIAHDAFQCGYCTSGQLCSAMGLISEAQARTEADIRELMSGNVCRCGAYPQIVQAIGEVMGIEVGQENKGGRRIPIGTVPA